MNIFNRRNEIDKDDLPGRERMPKATLPPVEEQLGDMVRDQFAKGPLTLDQRRARLDKHLMEFSFHHAAAREEANAYLEEHDAMAKELEAEKTKVLKSLEQLDKIAAGMPTFGGTDEKTPSDSNLDDNGNSGSRKDPVPIKSIEGLNKPLPLNRR